MTRAAIPPSTERWPGLYDVPTGPRAAVSAYVAQRLFLSAVNHLDVTVVLGTEVFGRGGPLAIVHRSDEFFARLGVDQLIGFGEAYLTGAWDAEDLGGFLAVLAAQLPTLVPPHLQKMRSLVVKRPPRTQVSTSDNAQANIAHHYDLSNDLFRLFLDPTMSYSAALFDANPARATAEDLEAAQIRKIERLLDMAGVVEGSRLLELGSGWGELALRAAQRGAEVRTITLSVEQQTLARERIAAAGLGDRVSVDLCDYRDVEGTYDAVVSVEMIEAVGWQFWQTYFEKIDSVLVPGGRAALQAITMPHQRMLATRNTYTWINKYVFPGGFLPSVDVIDEITLEHTSLVLGDQFSMGRHYAATLRLWDDAFQSAAAQVRELGFDETFERMWHFYLEYSRAGFASGYLDVNQLVLTKRG